MEEQLRKEEFVRLLEELLLDSGGIKLKLAKKLKIKPSTLTPWLQGKIDPSSLDILSFTRLAKLKALSVDEVAITLGVIRQNREQSLENKFKHLIQELLFNRSQQELAEQLGVSVPTIASWINPQRKIDPSKINVATIAGLAIKKKWTIEKLLAYLGLQENQAQENLLSRIKLEISSLSATEQLELRNWILNITKNQTSQTINLVVQTNLNHTIWIILEKEDNNFASRYTADLIINLQINPDNIQVTTIPKLPQSLDNIDVLIFDISTADSPSIALIEEIDFKGNILVFADPDLSQEIIGRISNRVTEVLLKPIDWNELKARVYFS